MKRRSSAFLLAALLLFSAAPAARAVDLPISAPAALLMEKETGTVLYAKDEHARFEPASVTKVMTLLLVMEAIDEGRLSYDDIAAALNTNVGTVKSRISRGREKLREKIKGQSELFDRYRV